MPFAIILMARKVLPYSYLAVTANTLHYYGHAHVLHRQQEP